jgi:uncharacterized protein YndB with AHSA1/START domain
MDLYAIFPSPVRTVFGHLADPGRLGDWLPGISAAAVGSPAGAGTNFPLTAQLDDTRVVASGEITAFEPSRLISYRFFIGPRAYGLRITCTAQSGGTRIHVHQSDDAIPLTIDLTRLTLDLARAAG